MICTAVKEYDYAAVIRDLIHCMNINVHLVQAVSIIREEFLMGQCNLYEKAELTSVKSTSLEPYKGVYQRLIITQYEVIIKHRD